MSEYQIIHAGTRLQVKGMRPGDQPSPGLTCRLSYQRSTPLEATHKSTVERSIHIMYKILSNVPGL